MINHIVIMENLLDNLDIHLFYGSTNI